MTDYNTLKTLLWQMANGQAAHPGCAGCGYEHNCQTDGCTILRDAIATMEQLYKDVTGHCKACVHRDVPYGQEPCKSCLAKPADTDCGNWQWMGVRKEDETDGDIPGNAKRV